MVRCLRIDRKKNSHGGERGAALTVVFIIAFMLMLVAGFTAQLGYNQRRLSQVITGNKVKAYYRAQAALVEANWRIRTNYVAGLTNPPMAPPADFTNDAYDPDEFFIDVDGDAVNDASYDIEAVSIPATKARVIRAKGLDI